MIKFTSNPLRCLSLLSLRIAAGFALPKHDFLNMPALSPTMKEGKILKWLIKEGDKVVPGDAIAEVETDKATMTFEVQEKGYIAKINTETGFIPIGDPVAVITKKSEEVGEFSSFDFSSKQKSSSSSEQKQQTKKSQSSSSAPPSKSSSGSQKQSKEYPSHSFLQMPAVSPTMTEGKILQWKIKPGDAFTVGDALFSIETDKAVVDYEATEKGVLAKVIAKENEALPIGTDVAVVVKKKQTVKEFEDYEPKGASSDSAEPSQQQQQKSKSKSKSAPQEAQTTHHRKSLLAEGFAKRHKEKTQASQAPKQQAEKKVQSTPSPTQSEQKQKQPDNQEKKGGQKGSKLPENPFQEIPLTGMRKTIAARLSESKQTIPHYYVQTSIEMDAVTALRTELNLSEKQNGVKISVNDIILKAMALALRDLPDVNVQWHGTAVRRFKHSDISVAVAIDGGLITPIVSRAETLGLVQISKKVKDLAKRARQGKLNPAEYTGGTSTISNLGMYGINTVSSIVNPPQATILGVGKTALKLLPFPGGPKPYRVAQVMDVIASCDHRAVDGALTAQWLNRIKMYLQKPSTMLL